MTPDVNIKSYYLAFIESANKDFNTHSIDHTNALQNKEKLHKYILDNKELFKEVFEKGIERYPTEITNKKPNLRNKLYNDALTIMNTTSNNEHKSFARQVVKYAGSLSKEEAVGRKLGLAKDRVATKYGDFTRIVSMYYNEVHKRVLQGDAYKFSNGIGVFLCNRWKFDMSKKRTILLDYKRTNENIAKRNEDGIPLYCPKTAKLYEKLGKPYDVTDHRVFRNDNHFYEFTIIKSKIIHSSMIQYERNEYLATKYRGYSYVDLAERICKKEEDIYNLQVDIKYKLNILLYKDPSKHLNFIRNAEQHKYKRGAHNSRDRQQLQS